MHHDIRCSFNTTNNGTFLVSNHRVAPTLTNPIIFKIKKTQKQYVNIVDVHHKLVIYVLYTRMLPFNIVDMMIHFNLKQTCFVIWLYCTFCVCLFVVCLFINLWISTDVLCRKVVPLQLTGAETEGRKNSVALVS